MAKRCNSTLHQCNDNISHPLIPTCHRVILSTTRSSQLEPTSYPLSLSEEVMLSMDDIWCFLAVLAAMPCLPMPPSVRNIGPKRVKCNSSMTKPSATTRAEINISRAARCPRATLDHPLPFCHYSHPSHNYVDCAHFKSSRRVLVNDR